MNIEKREGILLANSAGLVTVTAAAAGDLVHTLSTNANAFIRKIFYSNNSGAAITLIFGTRNTVGAFVPLMPTITCVNGQHDWLEESQIPDILFRVDTTAPGAEGNIYVLSSAAGVIVRATIEEMRV